MADKRKILIIGSGGREHAVEWKLKREGISPFFAPIKSTDIPALVKFAKEEKIDLTLALPDDPLALGIVDEFKKEGLRIFGPTQAAARLESSKAYAKNFMQKYGLPTAEFRTFTDSSLAKEYLKNHPLPVVVKASGLALGKGVFICHTLPEALSAVEEIMEKNAFGESGKEIVIEEFLTGPEISIHAFCDGEIYAMFPTTQDHKRIGEGDTGPNTGGMGTVAPLPFVTKEILREIEEKIVQPTLSGMITEGAPFQGVLYPGLILTKDGPKILEYNARFGDPETQSYMRLLETDLLEIIEACIDGRLDQIEIKWKKLSACTIVLASAGYPGSYEKGKVITGIEEAEKNPAVVVFQAGTAMKDGQLVTNGGRVLGVSATGQNLEEALATAYEAVSKISFEGMQYRRDIGKKAL